MLAPEEQRYSATQVLQHRWFQIVKEKKLEKIHFNISFLKEYNNANKLKKMVLLYIASRGHYMPAYICLRTLPWL